MRISEYLEVAEKGGKKMITCMKCGHEFCTPRGNYKLHCLIHEIPVNEIGPPFSSAGRLFCDADVVFRQFYCPGCGTLITNEVTVKGEPPFKDIEIEVCCASMEVRQPALEKNDTPLRG